MRRNAASCRVAGQSVVMIIVRRAHERSPVPVAAWRELWWRLPEPEELDAPGGPEQVPAPRRSMAGGMKEEGAGHGG